jgi:hypothetical protein
MSKIGMILLRNISMAKYFIKHNGFDYIRFAETNTLNCPQVVPC